MKKKKYVIAIIIVLAVCVSSLIILNSMIFDQQKSFKTPEFTGEKVSTVFRIFNRLAAEAYREQDADEIKSIELSPDEINALAAGFANRRQLAALIGLKLKEKLHGSDFCFSSKNAKIEVDLSLKSGFSTPFGEMVNMHFIALPLVDEKSIKVKVFEASAGNLIIPAQMVEDFVNEQIKLRHDEECYTIPRAIIQRVENKDNGNMIIYYKPGKLRSELLSRIYRN